VTSSFRREVDAKCALVGYYAASSGNFLPTFRNKGQEYNKKNPRFFTVGAGTDRLTETSARNDHYSLCNSPEERGCRLEEKFEDNIKLEDCGSKSRTNGGLKLRETVIRKVKKQMLKLY
jgi:hypothetical protein